MAAGLAPADADVLPRLQIPTLAFLYIAGYIGYVGRDYLIQVCGPPSVHLFCMHKHAPQLSRHARMLTCNLQNIS